MTDAQAQLAAAIWPPDREAPTREIHCRHCGRTNRVRIPSAVMSPERHDCGACHGRLFLTPDEPLTGIPSAAYEHGLDRKSLSALKSVPGFPALMRFVLKHVGERSSRLLFMSDSILCSEDQFPELLELLGVARDRLGVGLSPTLFLGESPYMNAMTTGVEEQLIVVRSALLDQLTDEEVMAVLGHELGHLHADHPLYQTLAWAVLLGGSLWSGLVRILSWPLQRALLKWLRCAELTADRAGLLATRDLDASIGVFVKLAGGNRPGTSGRTSIRPAPFIRQARELAEMESRSWLDGALATLLTLNRRHPHLTWRAMHLIEWVEHGGYLDILAGDYSRDGE